MKRYTIIINLTLIAAALVAVTSCRKELIAENPYVDVSLSFSDAPAEDAMFRGMVYDMADGHQCNYSFLTRDGGEIPVESGRCLFLVHTFGCETSYISGEETANEAAVLTNTADAATQREWETACDGTPVNGFAPREAIGVLRSAKVRWEPDAMLVGVTGTVKVPHRAIDERYAVSVNMERSWSSTFVSLTDVKGMEYVAGATLYVYGVAEGYDILERRPYGAACVAAVPMYRRGNELVTSFNHFGFSKGASVTMFLVLTDTGGTKFLYGYEPDTKVTETLSVASDIEVAEPVIAGESGLQPMIEDWNTVIIDVPL